MEVDAIKNVHTAQAEMKGLRVAIFGAGRSGISAAKAVLAAGGIPMVYEEARADRPALQTAILELQFAGAAAVTGWRGEFATTGCDLVVTSPGVDMRHPKLQQAVRAGIEVVSEIELAYRVSRAPIVAVTGTNGKSTTTVMTWLCLHAAGIDAVLCGNIYGSGYTEMPLTDAAAKSTPSQVLVAEVSSFQLEWVSKFKPIAAAITNISPDHLNRYADFDEYAATKQRVFAAQDAGDTAIVRARDRVVKRPKGPVVKTFGESGEHADAYSTAEALIVDGTPIPVAGLSLGTSHNRLNALTALLLAQAAAKDLDIGALARGLQQFRGLAHRMEFVGEKQGVRVFNNSMCTNPMAVESSCRSIDGRRHVLMGGVNKELGFEALARFLRDSGDDVYLFGRDGRTIADQLSTLESDRKHVWNTMQEAFADAAVRAKPGETVLLCPGCASFDQFEDFRHRGEVFRQTAKEWLSK